MTRFHSTLAATDAAASSSPSRLFRAGWWALVVISLTQLIVVLDGSRLAEVGSHDDLLRRNGAYAELYRIQAASYR